MSAASQEPMPDITELLIRHEGRLMSLVRREAGAPLLRFETPDDIMQGIRNEILRSTERLEWRADEAFVGWVEQIARRYILGRRDYWFALKRSPGAILRLTFSGVGPDGAIRRRDPADSRTGPATFADRREQLVMATKAVALLLPRDRELVTWTSEGVPLASQAERLGMTVDAATRARNRAVERLQRAFRIVSGEIEPPREGP